jgi:hypothetical protein
MRRRRARLLIAAVALIAMACRDTGESDPAPRPLGEATDLPGAAVAPPQEQAREIATNPRLLLFDLQTALESVRETRGSYPTVDEFGATESWALQREALSEAFETWSYESDGRTYRLTGYAGDREIAVESPR